MEEAAAAADKSLIEAKKNSDEEGHGDKMKDKSSGAVGKVRKLLHHQILVGIRDGRFFLGIFHCIDKQGNIILQDAIEYRTTRQDSASSSSSSSPPMMDQRCLGLILIPASCRTSCHVDCTIEEQLSLLSI